MKKLLIFVAMLNIGIAAYPSSSKPFVIPELREWKGADGRFIPGQDMRIVCGDASLLNVAAAFAEDWKAMFGTMPEVTSGKAAKGDISLSLKKDKSLGKEGYRVRIGDIVSVSAPEAVGVYWASRTLLQIAEQSADHSLPKGDVRDWPDYGMRGFMIDAGRKFIPLDYLKDLAKILSYYKMNVLHVHLNDCGFKQFYGHDWDRTYAAFRMECDTYPGLTARDGYYTKKDFGEFQDEAAERFVDVIPEIDVPAHTLAFTQYKPELGSKEYGMDHLDLFHPETYKFFDALFKEYLEGDKPVFRGPNVHIGTDEYSNKDQEVVEKFREFTDHYIRYVENFGKRACVWGSLTWARGTTPVKADNVLMYTWSRDFTNTQDMFDLGYKTISIPDRYVYIVPAAGYYYDYLDIEKLYDNWTPAHTVDKVYEERHPNISGGMFALWNDNCGNGISIHDIHHRTMPALQTMAVKTWNVGRTVPFGDFDCKRRDISEAPGVNRLAVVKGKSGVVYERALLTPGIKVPFKEIGYDYTVSFDIEAADEPLGTELFNSGNSVFYLSDPISGKIGFARDGYLYTFNFRPYPGEKVSLAICGDNKSTSLYVNGRIHETLDIKKCIYEGSTRPTYQVRTLVFPLGKACSFNSRITSFKISDSAGAVNADTPPYTIYPVPQKQIKGDGIASFSGRVNVVAGPAIDEATIQRAVNVLESHGLTATLSEKAVDGVSNLTMGVNGTSDAADKLADRLGLDRAVFSTPKYDRHILSLEADKAGLAQVLVLGEDTDAAFCGLASLEQILDGGTSGLCSAVIYDYADIRDRGIIEGYYGVPYSAEVTVDLFRFMARYKMNTYMYGAKSDPYHSRYWSEPYPENITQEQKEIGYLSQDMLKEITGAAHAAKVNFIWAIHPGNTFIDAADKDVNTRIMDKFESMYALGVRQFGVFVDDVDVPYDVPSLKLCADRLADLQNRIDTRWNVPGTAPADNVKALNYVPQLYAYSWTTRENARKFFESLSPTDDKINIYITGRAVWTVPNNKDIDVVRGYLGRSTGWWWNYPCNDNDMTKIFPMDIYTNFRDERHIDNNAVLEPLDDEKTLIVNPMQQGEISKIALFSVADYSWNNWAFDSWSSWNASLEAVVGKKFGQALRTAVPYLRYFDADALKLDVDNYKESVGTGHPEPERLIGKLSAVNAACRALAAMEESSEESDRLFYTDIRPWLLKLEAMTAEATALLKGEKPAPTDYENNVAFQFSGLQGMGEDISLTTFTAEPSAQVLRPFIDWLRAGGKK